MSRKRASSEIHRVGPYILGGLLGEGASSQVFSGFHVDTAAPVAVKMVAKEELEKNPAMRGKLEREIAVMKLLSHPHVLQLYDVLENDTHLFLIIEHAPNGELFDFLVQKGALDVREARSLFRQIASGIAYCHRHQICHRDLKPENLLLDANNEVKLADFGMAALRKDETLLTTSCGSPHYASPEVVSGKPYDGLQADVWSLGVILFALVSGKLPFDDESIRKLLQKVKLGEYSMPQYFPPELQDLISRMLTVDPVERITIEEVLTHEWFATGAPLPAATEMLLCPSALAIDPGTVVDPDVMRSMQALGFGPQPHDVFAKLANSESNLAKTFYWMLEDRRKNPKPLPPPSDQKLTRVQSDPKIEGKKRSKENRKLGRIGSGYGAPFRSFLLGKGGRRDSAASTSAAGAPDDDATGSDPERRHWLVSMFGRSTERFSASSHKREAQRMYSDQPLEKVQRRLEKWFDGKGVEWSGSPSKYKLKVPTTEKQLRVEVAVASATDAMGLTVHMISATFRQGPKAHYEPLVESMTAALADLLIDADASVETLFPQKMPRKGSTR